MQLSDALDEKTLSFLSTAFQDERLTVSAQTPAAALKGGPKPRGLPVLRVSDTDDQSSEFWVGGVLGRGGMADVFEGTQVSLCRPVAFKVPNQPHPSQASEALLREGRVMGMLEHPNIVPVHTMGIGTDGEPLLVMKRIEGQMWLDALETDEKETGRLQKCDLESHLRILMQICNAVHFAHAHGVVHRDLKPSNVMIGEYGEVYLLDWGIAVQTEKNENSQDESIVGTPVYMAPEMLSGEATDISPLTDTYQLGAVLHRLVTGRPPHTADTINEVISSILDSSDFSYDAMVPGELASICNTAMASESTARFESALAFREAIQDCLDHRNSLSISDSAIAMLTEFEALDWQNLAEGDSEQHRVYQLLTEGMFGCRQALVIWPGNSHATSCIQQILSHLVRWELRRGDPEAANRFLRDLPEKDEALEQEVAKAQHKSNSDQKRIAALEERARTLDPTVSQGWRVGVAAALAALTGVGPLVDGWLVRSAGADATPVLLLPTATGVLLGISTALFLARKHIATTLINRKLALVPLSCTVIFWLNRLRATLSGDDSFQTIAQEPMLFAMAMLIGAITLEVRMLAPGALFLATAFVASWQLEHAPEWVALGYGLASLALAGIWIRGALEGQDDSAMPSS